MKRQNKQRARSAARAFGGALAALCALFGCGKSKAAGANANRAAGALETVRLGVMTDSITDYAASVGTAEGIFAKHGLKVEVASFAAGINTIDAITTGQMDVGYGADFAVINRLGGSKDTPLRIFTGLGGGAENEYTLFGLNALKSPADLAGKSVALHLGTVEEYWLARLLEAHGLRKEQVNVLPVESGMEAVALLRNGSAQAAWGYGRTKQVMDAEKGVHGIANIADIGVTTQSVLVSTAEFLTARQDAAVKYLQATQEIFDFLHREPQRAAEIINKATGVPVEQVLVNLKIMVSRVDFDQPFFDSLLSLYRWVDGAHLLAYPYDLRRYISTDALKAAFPGRGDYK